MRRLFVILGLAGFTLVGCKSEDIDYWPEPDAGEADVVDASDVTTDGSGDASPDTGEDPQWAGLACETNQDCGTAPRQCVNRQTLDGFGVNEDIELPGGMCSRLLCTSDDDCGPNGTCFDASALGAPVQICLAQCEDIRDCRWEEGWDCIPMNLVTEGAEGGACVSDSLHVAILCDDGSCEEAEAE